MLIALTQIGRETGGKAASMISELDSIDLSQLRVSFKARGGDWRVMCKSI